MSAQQIMALADAYAITAPLCHSQQVEARAALEAAVTALERDAKRYRWFADIAVNAAFDKAEAAFACFEHAESCTKTELDAAIDAAMEAK